VVTINGIDKIPLYNCRRKSWLKTAVKCSSGKEGAFTRGRGRQTAEFVVRKGDLRPVVLKARVERLKQMNCKGAREGETKLPRLKKQKTALALHGRRKKNQQQIRQAIRGRTGKLRITRHLVLACLLVTTVAPGETSPPGRNWTRGGKVHGNHQFKKGRWVIFRGKSFAGRTLLMTR